MTFKDIIYCLIILCSMFFIFSKTIEGNTCSNQNTNRDYNIKAADGEPVKCEKNIPDPFIDSKNRSIHCDNNRPYVEIYE